ncbi:MAG: hypothetical protein V1740_04495 [Candidatus Woesearchaeota archaeon]
MEKIIQLLSICIISVLLIITISCTDDVIEDIDSDKITGQAVKGLTGNDLIIEDYETIIVEDGTTTTTITETPTSTTTTIPLIETEAVERILEKKYAYLMDLTTLTIDNCDSSLRIYENEKETAEDNIKDKKDDKERKKTELQELEEELGNNSDSWTHSQIENQKDDIDKVEKKIDELEKEIDDLLNILDNIEVTRVQIEKECKKIRALAD